MPTRTPAFSSLYRTPLGQWSQDILARKLASLWKVRSQERLLGVGYPMPYLPAFKAPSTLGPVLILEPEQAQPWPSVVKNRVLLGCEDFFPFPDQQFDKILVVHGLEKAKEPGKLLREMWRVLKPEGEMILVVPSPHHPLRSHKGSPWKGKALTVPVVKDLLNRACFSMIGEHKALFCPLAPGSAMRNHMASLWENVGAWGIWPWPGIWIFQVQKQVYQVTMPSQPVVCKKAVILVDNRI